MRSRAVSRPDWCCFSTRSAPPPSRARWRFSASVASGSRRVSVRTRGSSSRLGHASRRDSAQCTRRRNDCKIATLAARATPVPGMKGSFESRSRVGWGAAPLADTKASAEEIRAWVRAARAGDAGAFRRLVESHMRAVYALGFRLLGNHDDADDLAQETFVRAHRALDRYDERWAFYTWLRTIATRVALNEIAKRKRRRTEGGEVFDAAAESAAESAPDPIDQLAEAELHAALRLACDELPSEFRAVLVLRSQEGLSYAEIAQDLDLPLGTVMSRLHRARAMIRRALAAHGA